MGGAGPPCWPSVPAEDVPFYSRTEVLVGSAVMLALCLMSVGRPGGCAVATPAACAADLLAGNIFDGGAIRGRARVRRAWVSAVRRSIAYSQSRMTTRMTTAAARWCCSLESRGRSSGVPRRERRRPTGLGVAQAILQCAWRIVTSLPARECW